MISLIDNRSDNDPRPLPPGVDWLDVFRDRALRDRKDGPAFIGAVFRPGGKRRIADVESVTVAVYDVDEGRIDPSAIAARLEAAGVEHLIHSSHSHRATKPSLRVILPLARPIPTSAWARAWKRGADLIGPGVSKKSADPAHLFYLPSCPADHVGEAIRIYRPGPRVDLLEGDAAPSEAPPPPRAAPDAVVDLPPPRAFAPLEIYARITEHGGAATIYEGRPLEKGGRDTTIHELVSAIVFRSGGEIDEASVVAFFAPSIEAMAAAAPDDPIPLSAVVDKYRRAMEALRRKRAERAVADRALRDVLVERARGSSEPAAPAGPHDPGISAALARGASRAPVVDVELPEPVEAGPTITDDRPADYQPEELERLAALADATVETLDRRWIIQTGSSYFVLTENGYASPIQREALAASLPRDLARSPVQTHYFTKDGEARPVEVGQIIARHATVARRLISSLVDPVSRYDAATQTFYEAVAPVRPSLTPRYDAQIDRWLRLLGGSKEERLLDWVATVTDLSRPTCALYVIGPKGAGKTMIAHALARLWTVGSPTAAEQILVNNWTACLAECPLILADEGLPETRGRAMSQEVRALLGSSARPFTRKFKDDASLIGCVRLIVTANHDRAIASMMQGEARSAEDIEAVSERFLVIRSPDAAAKYLDSLGGRPATESWVAGDRIARHALWLRDHRQVDASGRWLVAGVAGDLSDSLSVSGTISSLVVEWICRAILEPGKIAGVVGDPPGFVAEEGRILIKPGFLHENFESYVVGQKTPTTHAIGQACSSLAPAGGSQVFHRRTRYRELRVEAIRGWACENLLVSPEDFNAAIGAV